jgi:hypothetical protein
MRIAEHGLCVYTTAASITISTKACSFMGINAYASAACTITIADSARAIYKASTDAGGVLVVNPPCPIACTGGLSVTDSGGGNYVIFYGK